MYGVTQALKNSVVYAVESLANEAIFYKLKKAKDFDEKQKIEALMASDTFAREIKDECLTFVYRLLFLFYAESREDLEILPVKDSVYQKGYSLEMLRDLGDGAIYAQILPEMVISSLKAYGNYLTTCIKDRKMKMVSP